MLTTLLVAFPALLLLLLIYGLSFRTGPDRATRKGFHKDF